MATIRTAIELQDHFTQVLYQVVDSVNLGLSAMDDLRQSMNTPVDNDVFDGARESIHQATIALQELEQSVGNTRNHIHNNRTAQEKFNQEIDRGTYKADHLMGSIKRMVAAYAGVQAIGKAVNLSDQLTSTTARLNLIVEDGGSVEELEAKIMASAERARAPYLDTASAIAKMGANARSAFSGNDELIAFVEQVNKQFVIGGASAQEQQYAMVQLTQAMSAGTLRGEELNSILDQAPGIARAIEQYMGIAEGSIKNYAEQGLITSQVVKNALFAAADETNAKFESMPKTWGQVWISMKNQALSIFRPILNKINEIANSDQLQRVITGVIEALTGMAEIAGVVLEWMVNIADVVVDNWSWISPVIYSAVTALLAYEAAVKGTAIAEGIARTAKALAVPVYSLLTGATMADTAAQWGLNAALYACPLVWVIALIIILIGLFYAAVAAVNHFAGTSVSATGVIVGAFMFVLAAVYNVFGAAWNFIVDVFVAIYNLVADVANFFANVFIDPIGAICRLFFDMADFVLGILQAIASAIDFIFGSNLAESVQGWRSGLKQWVDDTFGKGEEVIQHITAEEFKLERQDPFEAWEQGYQWGAEIEENIKGMFNIDDIINEGMPDLTNTLNGIYNNTGDTVDNTKKMSDGLEISGEDLKYLRDLAERDVINRFTTAEIKVEMTNNNTITDSRDLDGLVDSLGDKVEEMLVSAAEGVHV